jgi:uncharacterized protein YcbK (DUF882 family)
MGDIASNFNRSEFACKCGCGFDTVDSELLRILIDVRNHFKSSVTINSGCRCLNHNSAVGGKMPTSISVGSQHLYGRAADISVSGFTPREVVLYLYTIYPYLYGIGEYQTFIHIDSRGGYARW